MQAEIRNNSDKIFEGICKGAVKIHRTICSFTEFSQLSFDARGYFPLAALI